MAESWTLYGAKGWGSVLADAMLTRCGAPFTFVDVEGFDEPSPARARLVKINPLAQVPTLVTPTGVVMTESVAIALLLAETFPQSRLAPSVRDPLRPRFLRRLVWFGAAIYPTFTFADYPARWAPSAKDELYQRVEAHRQKLWRTFEEDLVGEPWPDVEETAIGIYIAAMTRWRPRRQWFAEHCPRLSAIAQMVDAQTDLAPVWGRNFPDQA